MKHRMHRKAVLLALAALVVAIHVAVLHVVSVREWWPVTAGIALVLVVKAAIIAHLRKSRRAKATTPEMGDQRQSGISG